MRLGTVRRGCTISKTRACGCYRQAQEFEFYPESCAAASEMFKQGTAIIRFAFLDQRLQLQGGGWIGGRETGGSGTSEKSTLVTQAILPKDG